MAQIELLVDHDARPADFLDLAAQAIPLFEELGDDRALGRTWVRVPTSAEASRATTGNGRKLPSGRWFTIAARAGRRQRVSASLVGALYYGPTPVVEAFRRCEELLVGAAQRPRKRSQPGRVHGGTASDAGEFEEARRLVASARATFDEIGLDAGHRELLRSYGRRDRDRQRGLLGAEPFSSRELRKPGEMREHALLASRAAELAEALCALGRFDEAAQWLVMSEQHAASDDVDAQSAWRAAGAEVKAGIGNLTEAETLAREAVRLAKQTDMLNRRGRTLLVLAEVLRRQSRFDEVAQPIEKRLASSNRRATSCRRGGRGLIDELVRN